MVRRQRLSAADWTVAALEALAEDGVPAIAVEPLAVRLGATKGSFYWHFRSRDALIAAALQLWEQQDTEAAIEEVEELPAGLPRLRALLLGAVASRQDRGSRAEIALQATPRHPLVAPVLERVTRRRLDYLAEQFVDLGFDPEQAAHRAQLAYTSYLGLRHLAVAAPGAANVSEDYLDTVLAVLTSEGR